MTPYIAATRFAGQSPHPEFDSAPAFTGRWIVWLRFSLAYVQASGPSEQAFTQSAGGVESGFVIGIGNPADLN
jgi:hypothetical protein